MRIYITRSLTQLLVLLFATALHAEVKCPSIFSDHMVLQRNQAVAIWGEAAAGEAVVVEFAGQSKATKAGTDGRWQVALTPLQASAEARTLTVRGVNTLTFSDVLVGEVWFCSGQSNMEKPLGPRKGQKPTDAYEEELTRADFPAVRLFQVPRYSIAKPGDATLAWLPCNATTLMQSEFSAAAYYFGRELHRELGVPIGLIHSSFGGTRIEAWMPEAAFTSNPELQGLEKAPYDKWVKGVQATELYQSMVTPFVPYGVRGFLWYQGESNCINADHLIYATKLRALIGSWRTAWGNPDAPFYYVLIAPFTYSHQKKWAKQLTPDALPALWEAQVKALDVPHTGLIVTTDIAGNGKDIHPSNKREVGLRLARLALADTYGRSNLAAHSPQFSGFKLSSWSGELGPKGADATTKRSWSGKRIELSFQHADGLRSRDGKPLTDFSVAGKDRQFHPAEATIENGKVLVICEQVPEPVAVRFAWHELSMPNLENAAGHPSLPFRTDDWPLVLEVPKEVSTK